MKNFILGLFFTGCALASLSQNQVTYADVSKSDVQRMNFEIIGKSANNYLIYKEAGGNSWISVYDENMKILHDVPITVIPDNEKLLDVNFVNSRGGANMIYQYQDGDVLRLMAVKLEANGHIMDQPQLLDTTHISYQAESGIYNCIASNDHSKILLFRVNRKDRSLHQFKTMLYDQDLHLLGESYFSIPIGSGDYLGSYSIDNNGNLAFIKYNRQTSGNITTAGLVTKRASGNEYETHPLNASNYFLDDIKIKVDDANQRYVLTSFYTTEKKGRLEGLYISGWNITNTTKIFEKTTPFTEDFITKATGNKKSKSALDDYFISSIVLNNDGGFNIATEALAVSNTGYNGWNYWGPFYGPYNYVYYPYYYSYRYYYSPFFYRSYWWGGNWYGDNRGGLVNYYAGNVAVFSFDKDGNPVWDKVIVKKQNSIGTDGDISYQILLSDGNMHFLLNNSGKIAALEDVIINTDGTITKAEPVEAKSKGIDFMPKYARQVSPTEMIMPYSYKNQISFIKLMI